MSIFSRLFGESEKNEAAKELEAPTGRPGPAADYWYEVAGRTSTREALAIPAVSSGIRYISETLASMPVHIYERIEDGRNVAKDHWAYHLIHDQPNRYQTSIEFFEQVIREIICNGAHVSRLRMENTRRIITEIEPLEWSKVSILKDRSTGLRVFKYQDGTSEPKFLLDDEVLFIYGPGSTPWVVQSILDQLSETLQISSITRRYLSNFIAKGGIGPVYAQFPEMLNKDVKQAWVDWFKDNFSGARNAGKIPVLDGKAELKPLRVDHDKMQLVDLQRFYIEEVARVLRVPPHKIQDLHRSTNNNIEEQGHEAVSDCLRSWAKRIESRLNVSIFGALEASRFYCEFDLDGLLRGNAQAQAVLMGAEIQNAVRTPNEWRRIRNLNRYKNEAADKLYIQGATVPIEISGQQQQQSQSPASQAAEEAEVLA